MCDNAAATTIADAVAAMQAIEVELPAPDGIAAFNRMYLAVTQAVGDAVSSGVFSNSAFLERLDVVFANHYLHAVAQARAGLPADLPECWGVLWEHRLAPDRAQLQFAIAGMNAHINHDLVLALVETFAEMGLDPHDRAVLADFDRVNVLLGDLDPQIRRSYETGVMIEIDDHLGRVEDCIDKWSIVQARSIAWHDAALLWRVREHAELRARYERALDEATAAAGRCLLLPLGRHEHHEGALCTTQAPALAGATPPPS